MDLGNFGENQELYEAEKTSIMEKLAQLDPSTEEYSNAMRNLHLLDEVAENERKSVISTEELMHADRRTKWQVAGSLIGSFGGIVAIMFGETVLEKIFTSKAMGWIKKP